MLAEMHLRTPCVGGAAVVAVVTLLATSGLLIIRFYNLLVSTNKLLIVIFHVCKYMYIMELTTFMYVRLTLQAVGVCEA